MKKDLISANNFARISNHVFVEEVTLIDFETLKNDNLIVLQKDSNYVCYINLKIELKENDIIFCKTDYIDLLFKYLKTIKNLKNIKLITSQSDLKVDKRLFQKKPSCVSKWYSTNVVHKDNKLISLPLGLANEFSEKNLNHLDFKKFGIQDKEIQKENYVYSNFNINTKYLFRKRLLSSIINNKKFKIRNNDLNLNEYRQDLNIYKYVLCPPGNGIDTHRIWEAIYSNSIPIVFREYYLDYFSKVPVIVLDSIDDLENFDLNKNVKKYDSKALFINWWIDLIRSESINSENKKNILIKKNQLFLYLKIKFVKTKLFKIIKILRTIYIKIDRKLQVGNKDVQKIK